MDLDAICSRGPGQWRSSGHSGSSWRQDNQHRFGDDKEYYNCGGIGHIAQFCSSPRHQQNNTNRQFQGKGQARRN